MTTSPSAELRQQHEEVGGASSTPSGTTSPALGSCTHPPPTGDTSTSSLPAPVATSRNVYVASLPQTLNDAELMNLFSPFGIVLSAKIMREKKTRQSKGYGFVLFRDEEAAAASVRGMNTAVVGNNRLQVRLAHPSASKDLQKQCRSIPQCQSVAASSSTSSLPSTSQQHHPQVPPVHGGCKSSHGVPLTGPTYRAPQPPTHPHSHTHAHPASMAPPCGEIFMGVGGGPFGHCAAAANGAAGNGFVMPVVMLLGGGGDDVCAPGGGFGFTPQGHPQGHPVFLPASTMPTGQTPPYGRGWF